MSSNSPFEHILCVRSDDHFYKLVFIYSAKLPERKENLLFGEMVRKLIYDINYTIGYLEKTGKKME